MQYLNPEVAHKAEDLLLGIQACVWGEYIPDAAKLHIQTFPRSATIAEVAWTPDSSRNWNDFRLRLEKEFDRLEAKGVGCSKAYWQVIVNMNLESEYPREIELELDYPYAVIRYTTDGTEPTAESPLAPRYMTVKKGDTLWKIAVSYRVGLSEIKSANPTVKNYDLIYPGQIINIPTASASVTAYENEVVRLVNIERANRGLSALEYDWQLSRVARYKSEDMQKNNYFSHTSPTYGSPFNMMKSFGITYKTAGENIAKGYKTPAAVVEGWMNSPGHRANILNSSFTHIGVGYVQNGNYWTQMFIGK